MANNYTNSIDSEIQDSSEIDSQLTSVVVVEENAPIKSISVNGVPSSIVNENVDISVPEKTSDIQNDGDGISPFATEQFVRDNGGKIDSISVNGVEQPIDENKNVDIELPENIAETDKNNNFSTSQTINGTLTVNGNIVQNGESYETHAERVYTKNDTIILREGAVGGLGNDEYAGFEAEKYDGENTGVLGFGADGVARVGDKGNEQPLLTREESEDLSNGDVLVWNSETNRAEGSSDYVKFTDYPTEDKAGVHKVKEVYGTRMVDGVLDLMPAQYSEIDSRTPYEWPLYMVNNYTRHMIVPANFDYAFKKAFLDDKLKGTEQEWTDEEKTSALNWLGAVKQINTNGFLRAYGIAGNGSQTFWEIITNASTVGEGRLPRYVKNTTQSELYEKDCVLSTGTPTQTHHATNKEYVDGLVPKIELTQKDNGAYKLTIVKG